MAKNKDVSIFWITVKFVTPVVVLLSLIPSPNGKPFIDWSDLMPSADTQQKVADLIDIDISDFSADDLTAPFKETKTRVYKWRDEKGQWHFSQDPPLHLKSETMILSNKINTMKAPEKMPEKRPASATSSFNTSTPTGTGIGLPYGNVKQLMQDAKNLQKISDERAEKFNNL